MRERKTVKSARKEEQKRPLANHKHMPRHRGRVTVHLTPGIAYQQDFT